MASSERQELVRIHRLLKDDVEPDDNLSDLELLRAVVRLAKSSQDSLVGDDSLAFPKETRDKLDLAKADKLWPLIDKFNDQLRQDYTCRRQMMLRRLDCTVESFKWKGSYKRPNKESDTDPQQPPKELRGKAKTMNDQIHERYDKARMAIREEPQVSIAHLLALRQPDCDKLLNSVVSSKYVDCQINYSDKRRQSGGESSKLVNLKQVIIPDVPDRGGRTGEMRPPPRESFGQQRGRGRGGGRHSRHGGGHSRR